jgi:O-antigen/teichoic acid export membrane protein
MLPILKSTLKNTFIYSIGTFSSRLAGFILIPLYTSHFSTQEYGMMSIMEITSQILLAFLGFSLYNSFFRWYWDKQYIDKQKSIFFTILVFILFQIVIFLIFILSFQRQLSYLLFDSDRYAYLIRLLIMVNGFEAFGVLISTLLRLKEQAVFYTILQIIKLVVSLVVTIILIVYHDRNIEAVYEAQVVANILYFILIFNILRKHIIIKFEWAILKDMLSFSLPLVLTSVSGIILNVTDRYTLRFLSDMGHVGVYSLGFKVANTLRAFIITSVNLALQPIIFKMMDNPANKRFYAKVMTYFTFGLMFFVLFFALFSPEIVKIISKRNMEYWDAYKIVPILSISMLFSMLRDVAYTGLNITKKTKLIALTILAAAIFNILLNIFLIPAGGFYGASAATTISQIAFFIAVYYFAQKHYPVPYEIKKILLMILVGIFLYFIVVPIETWPLIWRILIKMALICFFPFILCFFNFYEPVELERIGQLWQKWRHPSNWWKKASKLN